MIKHFLKKTIYKSFESGFYSIFEEIKLKNEKYIALDDVELSHSKDEEAQKRMADKEETGTHIIYNIHTEFW